MAKLMGSDKESIAKNNKLLENQKKVSRVQRAVIFCYDNYRRGLKHMLHVTSIKNSISTDIRRVVLENSI